MNDEKVKQLLAKLTAKTEKGEANWERMGTREEFYLQV